MNKELFIEKSKLQGSLSPPPSKSHSHRAILFASLAKGKSQIKNILDSSDTEAMVRSCRTLGAYIEKKENGLEIEGTKIVFAENVIDAGNSGIVLRFCSAIGALATLPIVITGDASIRHQRPMQALLSGLTQLGVRAESMRGDGFAPIIIKGPLKSGKVVLDGLDSQPVSALLIACSLVEGTTEIVVKNPGEKPWVEMTLHWLKKVGVSIEHQDYAHFVVKGRKRWQGFSYHVPCDFSSASYAMAAALVTGSEIEVQHLDLEDVQGDKEVIALFRQMGADICEEKGGLKVKGGALQGISCDLNGCIDAVPLMAVVGCFAKGKTVLYNVANARNKESNRLRSIVCELKKMGAKIEELEDGLCVETSSLKGCTVQTYGDQRMALSLAVAAMGAKGRTHLMQAGCHEKTYPGFVVDFQRLGANIK